MALPTDSRHQSLLQPYHERAALPGTSPLAAHLFRMMAAKRTNLCVSADVRTTKDLLLLAEEVGEHICLLKTHADIIDDFGSKTMHGLQEVAQRRGFLIFEDRKFGDIGNTVQLQYTAGPLQISKWSHIINAHIFPGPAIVTALAEAAQNAVMAYNTSIETRISGPPVTTSSDSSREALPLDGTPDTPEARSDGEPLEDMERATYSADEDDQVNDLQVSPPRRKSSAYAQHHSRGESQRKLSAVSVSTTISTTTEHISPRATPLNQQSFPRSTVPVSTIASHADNTAESLGDPPMSRALLLLAQMSSADNLFTPSYTAACVSAARAHPHFVMGFIAQESLNTLPADNFITMTPGVQIGSKGDGKGQQYNTPEYVVGEKGADVVIVGRGVYAAADRAGAAREYKERSWRAYEERTAVR